MSSNSYTKIICVGTNEGGLVGSQLRVNSANEDLDDSEIPLEVDIPLCETSSLEAVITPLFSYHPHPDGIRSVCLIGNTLLTGGNNEIIKVYNIAKGAEMQSRLSHNNSINVIRAIYDPTAEVDKQTYILTGDADGVMYLWNGFTLLEPIHKFRMINKNPFIDVSIHPSAKLALSIHSGVSVGIKRTTPLAVTWDLQKGALCGETRLERDPKLCAFNYTGDSFYILYQKTICVHKTVDEGSVYSHSVDEEGCIYTSASWILDDLLAVGTNNGTMFLFNSPKECKRGDELLLIKRVEVPHELRSPEEPMRLKAIFRLDKHRTGIIHVLAVSTMGKTFFYAADRVDICRGRASDTMNEFILIADANVRVATSDVADYLKY